MDHELSAFLGFLVLNLTAFSISLFVWRKYNRVIYSLIKRDHSKSPTRPSYNPKGFNPHLHISSVKSINLQSNLYENDNLDTNLTLSSVFGKKYKKIVNNEVKIYINFLFSNARMLLICSIIAFIIYTALMIYLSYTGQPWSFWHLSNIVFSDNKHLIHTIYTTVWIYSLVIYFHILYLLTDYKVDKKSIASRAQLHTLMVSGISKVITDPQPIYDHFDDLFPGNVISCHLVMDYTKRLLYEDQLERLMWQLRRHDLNDPNRRPAAARTNEEVLNALNDTTPDTSSENAGKIELAVLPDQRSILAFHRKRQLINSNIEKIREKLKTVSNLHKKKSTGIAFVSFKDARCVYNTLTNSDIIDSTPTWRLEPAPHPKNIIWLNMRFNSATIFFRGVLFNLMFISFYILITYIMARFNLLHSVDLKSLNMYYKQKVSQPIFALDNDSKPKVGEGEPAQIDQDNSKQVLISEEPQAKNAEIDQDREIQLSIERIRKKESKKVIRDTDLRNIGNISFWRALLPPIVMGLINCLLHPYVITIISQYIGFRRESTHQRYRLFGHSFYLITGTILVPLLSSILSLWQIFNNDFIVLSKYLGLVMSGASWAYAAIYIVNATFFSACNHLLQGSQIFCRWFSRTFLNYDYGHWDFDFGYWYAFHTSILTLILMFSTLVPSVMPLGTVYFVMRYYIDRFNLTNGTWKIALDTTGKIGSTAIRSMLISVSLFQLGMSGIFLNCKDALPPIYPMLLFIASVASWLLICGSTTSNILDPLYRYNKKIFKPISTRTVDFIKVCYLHPCDKADLLKLKHNMSKPGSNVY